jgi:hypothetical protein
VTVPARTTAPARTNAPGQRPFPSQETALCAEPGDTLLIDGAGTPGIPRTGIIVAVTGPGGKPPYVVRWTTGDYVSRVIPGPGARVERPSA